MRVADYLHDQQIPFERLWHPPAYSSQKRAKYLGVSGRCVAKAVLLMSPRGFVVAVLPASQRVDTESLERELGGPVRLATDCEVGQVFADCEFGIASTFGGIYGLPTLLDEALSPETWLVCEANSNGEAVRLLVRDFERLEKPRRLRFAR
jgi:Ala-tRNA(Pro) deacylase